MHGSCHPANIITDGLLLAAVVVGWATVIDFLDYKLPSWRIASAGPLELVRDGHLSVILKGGTPLKSRGHQ